MMDCARRWTAASLIGVGRSITTDKVVYKFVGGLRLQGIQLVFTVLPPWLRTGMWWCGEDHWPVKDWLIEGQTATGTMARCTLTSPYTTMQYLR